LQHTQLIHVAIFDERLAMERHFADYVSSPSFFLPTEMLN
jgi:hypothetical protein